MVSDSLEQVEGMPREVRGYPTDLATSHPSEQSNALTGGPRAQLFTTSCR